MNIDIVIAWVDGSDPAWRAEKKAYLPSGAADSDSENRYRDWGLLPYWFRAVEAFAPWVRKIHFVTWGHIPDFLNAHHPKLHIVRHTDFIPAPYLPTFSSHTIELNLHRIDGLAEHFIYFNDDMFLLRPMAPTDFFRDGLPCTYGAEVPWIFRGSVGTWAHAAANNMGVINSHFSKKECVRQYGKKYTGRCYRWQDRLRTLTLEKLFPDHFTGFANLHAPGAYQKSTFQAVWEAEPTLLDQTCRHRFREPTDVNQWVFLWWQIAAGHFAPSRTDNQVMSVTEDTVDLLCQTVQTQAHNMVCINDPDGDVPVDILRKRLHQAFASILPERSAFEKEV